MDKKKEGLTKGQRQLAWTVGVTFTFLIGWFMWLYLVDGGKRRKDQVFKNAGRYLKNRHDGIRKPR